LELGIGKRNKFLVRLE